MAWLASPTKGIMTLPPPALCCCYLNHSEHCGRTMTTLCIRHQFHDDGARTAKHNKTWILWYSRWKRAGALVCQTNTNHTNRHQNSTPVSKCTYLIKVREASWCYQRRVTSWWTAPLILSRIDPNFETQPWFMGTSIICSSLIEFHIHYTTPRAPKGIYMSTATIDK